MGGPPGGTWGGLREGHGGLREGLIVNIYYPNVVFDRKTPKNLSLNTGLTHFFPKSPGTSQWSAGVLPGGTVYLPYSRPHGIPCTVEQVGPQVGRNGMGWEEVGHRSTRNHPVFTVENIRVVCMGCIGQLRAVHRELPGDAVGISVRDMLDRNDIIGIF